MDSLQDIKAYRRRINPIYLWYSVILLTPPVHEWGHVIIAKAIGEGILEMHWNYVLLSNPTSLDFLHDWWEYSPWIAAVCVILFAYLFLKDLKENYPMPGKKVADEV